ETDADVITILQPHPDIRRAKGSQGSPRPPSDRKDGKAGDLAADDMVRRVVRRRDVHPRIVLEMQRSETVRIARLQRGIRDGDAHGRNKSRPVTLNVGCIGSWTLPEMSGQDS